MITPVKEKSNSQGQRYIDMLDYLIVIPKTWALYPITAFNLTLRSELVSYGARLPHSYTQNVSAIPK